LHFDAPIAAAKRRRDELRANGNEGAARREEAVLQAHLRLRDAVVSETPAPAVLAPIALRSARRSLGTRRLAPGRPAPQRRTTSSASSRGSPSSDPDLGDEPPGHPPRARLCACGCLRSLEGRRANARYFDGACRVRALRARRAATRPQTWAEVDVTVTAAPAGPRRVRYVMEAA